MTEVPKRYDAKSIEEKWAEAWRRSNIYKFDPKSEKPVYSIDTPPPYPSGSFHMGNALNWIYFDSVARYKRMRGYNVLFPQGWDCHGLPTEVQVERKHNIRKGDVPREEFRKMCIELTEENIRSMREEMIRLGFSIDWSLEYRTMDPDYWRRTQLAFIKLYKKGLIYRGEHPVEWCPRCQTAIAHAEVEYEEREGSLNYILFDDVLIATTRPELLCACVAVAVNPHDERNKHLIGRELTVPLYERKVKVISDPDVDPEFGTGVVMVCTFGDRTDVKWVKKYGLPVIEAIDERGRMTGAAGKYAGMSVEECKREIVKDLEAMGLLKRREKLSQKVGVCWRCETPVEIISRGQWFFDVTSWRDKILEEASKVKWVPEHMMVRLKNWAESMDWDWVISRQRLFATPIPVWYCKRCGKPLVAEEDEVPVDPTLTSPRRECECGSREFEPEKDVFDTWMDSSLTIAVHSGWPDDMEKFRKTFPADLQANGTDIIRTWDYYLLVHHLALFGRAPYKTVLINGMVVGEDGRKMSKSLGNYVLPSEPVEKYGADAVRQWALLGGAPGSDIPFKWKDVVAASRFLQKLWSIYRFCRMHADMKHNPKLRAVDEWLLDELNNLIVKVTDHMENFKFDEAMKEIRRFTWQIFADEYLEIVKHRLYGNKDGKDAAQHTLYVTLKTLAKLIAPFSPFIAEEIYSFFNEGSVHLSSWPEPLGRMDQRLVEIGRRTKDVISAVRRYKAANQIALNAPLKLVRVCGEVDGFDVEGATNSKVELCDSLEGDFIQAGDARIVIER